MSEKNHVTLYVTAGNLDEAKGLCRTLVEEKLIACANILPHMHAVYRWEGAVEEAGEVAILMKTRREAAERAIKRISALHSYAIPCVTVWDIAGGLPAYLDWIDQQTVS